MATRPSPPDSNPSNPPTLPSTSSPSSTQQPTYVDALKTISPITDLQRLPNIPCARYSLLFGIVAGASIGAIRFLFSSRIPGSRWASIGSASNWAVGAWGVGSLGAWETCRRRQTTEAAKMHAIIQEIKNRREQKPGSSKPIGGVLVGDKGREMVRSKKAREPPLDVPEVTKPDEKQGRPWYRRLI